MQYSQTQFVEHVLQGSEELSELYALLGEVNESYTQNLATMMFILETCNSSKKSENHISHIKENYSKVRSIIEQYNIQLPEETSIIENVVKRFALKESAGGAGAGAGPGGTTGGVSVGGGSPAGSISTAAAVATPQIDTSAIDSKTPRIYPNKKRKNNIIIP